MEITDHRSAQRPPDTAENKRPLVRQGHAINGGLGDTKNPCADSRTCQRPKFGVAGTQHHAQRSPHLPHHGRQQQRHHGVAAKHAQVVDHQGNQSPVQAKDHAHLPHRAHKRPGNNRVKGVNTLIAIGQQMAEPGGRRADQQESQRDGDHQAQQRRNKVADRAVDHPVKQRLQAARNPGGKYDRNDRRAVVDKGQWDTEEILPHRIGLLGGFKRRHHQGVGQSTADRHADEGVTAKFFPSGVTEHDGQKVKQRITGSKQHFKGAAALQQPAAGQAQCQEAFQDPRSGHHPQQRSKNAGDHVDKAAEKIVFFVTIFRHRLTLAQAAHLIDRVVDVGHMVAYHHLKLPAAFHHHDHTRIFFQGGGVGTAAVAQLEAQASGAVHQAFYVVAATDAGQNLTG
ncbi:hypothetical protein D3C71_1214580 [compost metagenome]